MKQFKIEFKSLTIIGLLFITIACGSDDDSGVVIPEINDYAPILMDKSITVLEHTIGNITIMQATDEDDNTLVYSIISQSTANGLVINESTGEITTADTTVLDYEKFLDYNVTIKVSDGIHDTTASLIIRIQDIAGPEIGLLAYYPFDTLSTVYLGGGVYETLDKSVNDNDGNLIGGTNNPETTNRFANYNSAYDFPGGGRFVEIPSFGEVANRKYSITTWVNHATPNATHSIVSKVGTDVAYSLELNNGYLKAFFTTGGFSNYFTITSTDTVPTGEWVHLVFTADINTNGETVWSIYVNGILSNSSSWNGVMNSWTNGAVRIGAFNASGANIFGGKIDDVLFYDRVLTTQEITALANNEY